MRKTFVSAVLALSFLPLTMQAGFTSSNSSKKGHSSQAASQSQSDQDQSDEQNTSAASASEKKLNKAAHVLNRITFGPRPGDIEDIEQMGVENFIQQQLHPETIQEDPSIRNFISSSPALTQNPVKLYREFGPPAFAGAGKKKNAQPQIAQFAQNNNQQADGEKTTPENEAKKQEQKARRETERKIYKDVADAKLMRAVDSPRQLEEVMTEFWFNHFNIFSNKGLDRIWLGAYEEQAIRPFALGKFRDLVGATCHHSGMLFYLDNWRNSSTPPNRPGKEGGKGQAGLNENYARELMELHTLGVDGGYTQQDVIQLAHVLTGLGLPPMKQGATELGANDFGWFFNPRKHDGGDKVLLGQTIQSGGEEEIEKALDILCAAPATAHHISYQLAQYFICDDPPEALVNKLASVYTKTNGDIREMMNALLHSKEFWDPKYADSKFKSPFRYVVSCLRATDAHPQDYDAIEKYLRQQGEPLYGCLTPDGYKNTKTAWLNPSAILHRVDFATTLASGRFKDISLPPQLDYHQVEGTMGNSISSQTLTAVDKAPAQLKAAMVLGSPEFMLY